VKSGYGKVHGLSANCRANKVRPKQGSRTFSPQAGIGIGSRSASDFPSLTLTLFASRATCPFAAHSRTLLRNSPCTIGTATRPSPGCHPQSTNGDAICSTICCPLRRPFRLGSLRSPQCCLSVRPSQITGVSGDGRCHPGAPGGVCNPVVLRP